MPNTQSQSTNTETKPDFDALIVGAGIAGMYMLHRLRELGLSARVFEAGTGVGGTWYWNRYPGARCDVESMEYSYQFSEELQQQWQWTERYAPQPEILKYLNHVADRFNLRTDIEFNTRVKSATYDEETNLWAVKTEVGDQVTARFCIMATGCLSSTNLPEFKGLKDFKGDWYHTGQWPHEGVDFTGKRVGVIGTGSSAIQSIPLIAEQAKHLTVFQRTPNFSIPAHNRPLDTQTQEEIKADYANFRQKNSQQPAAFGANYSGSEASVLEATPEERKSQFETRWENGGLLFMGAFGDLGQSEEANEIAADFVRNKIQQIVDDPAVAAQLCPEQVIGCKRICVDTNYFQTYNRSNVQLVDVSDNPIDQISQSGVKTNDQEYELDAIVFATGFDAMTGSLNKIDIFGTDAIKLKDKWAAGPRTYLGLSTAGFPNLFIISGPGSPSVLSNMIVSIEQHVNWIGDCINYMNSNGHSRINAEVTAEDEWVSHVNSKVGDTLLLNCNSWYLGANIPGKPRVFMPYLGYPDYVEKCNEVVDSGYAGFQFS